MISYLFIFLAVVFNAAKGYCSKRVSGMTETLPDHITLSLLRNGFCTVIGGICVLILSFTGADLTLTPEAIAICALSGLSNAVTYIAFVMALRGDAYMLVSGFNSASFLVSSLGGILILSEHLTLGKGAAILLIVTALILLSGYQKQAHGKLTAKAFALLLLVTVTAGIASFTQKLFVRECPGTTVHLYTFLTFAFAFVLLLLYRIIRGNPRPADDRRMKIRAFVPWAVFMAAALYLVNFFQSTAAKELDALVLYPLNNGLSLIAGVFLSWFALREKPSWRSLLGVALVFAALVSSRF